MVDTDTLENKEIKLNKSKKKLLKYNTNYTQIFIVALFVVQREAFG